MFCPECRGEFREGFTRCLSCDADLVDSLEPLPEPDASELVPLVTTADVPYLLVLKSVLESAGIDFSVSGEESLQLVTFLPSGSPLAPHTLGATIFVHPADLVLAQEVLSDQEDQTATDD